MYSVPCSSGIVLGWAACLYGPRRPLTTSVYWNMSPGCMCFHFILDWCAAGWRVLFHLTPWFPLGCVVGGWVGCAGTTLGVGDDVRERSFGVTFLPVGDAYGACRCAG